MKHFFCCRAKPCHKGSLSDIRDFPALPEASYSAYSVLFCLECCGLHGFAGIYGVKWCRFACKREKITLFLQKGASGVDYSLFPRLSWQIQGRFVYITREKRVWNAFASGSGVERPHLTVNRAHFKCKTDRKGSKQAKKQQLKVKCSDCRCFFPFSGQNKRSA